MRKTALLGALLIGCALPTIHTTAAAAADCTTDLGNEGYVYLSDSSATWDIYRNGRIDEGYLIPPPRLDAYDGFAIFGIDDGTNGRESYANPDETCVYEAEGRQAAFPTMTTLGGLELSRKVYVPATGPGYARFFNQVHNPGTDPVTITVYTADQGAFADGLGSDSATTIEDSSAGPGVAFVGGELDTAVSWFTTSDNSDEPDADVVVAHNLDAALARTVDDRVDSVVQEGGPDIISFAYEDVTIPAGGTVAYVLFEAMRASADAAGEAARYMDGHPAALFTGLTEAELAAIQNWDATDVDGDGEPTTSDNCPDAANGEQGDLDGDETGDACDPDIDGDGIANEVETAYGTNPLLADTDGDGVGDNADSCPKISGTGVDGCPVTTVPGGNERRASTTTLKVTKNRLGPVTITTKGKVTGTGGAQPGDCTRGWAQVVVKVGKLAVSQRLVKLTQECRITSKVTLKQPRRLAKNLSVTGRFLGSDGLLPSKRKVFLG